jgi:hypothetical protein
MTLIVLGRVTDVSAVQEINPLFAIRQVNRLLEKK